MISDAATITEALTLWGLAGAEARLIAARENRVYRITQDDRTFALRLHRPGYRSDAELLSELNWLRAAAAGGLSVPCPIAARDGADLHHVGGVQVDFVSWLTGRPMGATAQPLDLTDRKGTLRQLGTEMARLHEVSDRWKRPQEFSRTSWDRNGLLGDAPVWGRFWENPTLSPEDRDLMRAFRRAADAELATLEPSLDFGLIHADLVRENVLIDGDEIQLIDFDDGGFGFRLFDLATTLGKLRDEPDFGDLKAALIDGYRSVRPLETTHLDLFMALRAATYVGWIIPRMAEDGAAARNTRFIEAATALARNWMMTARPA